MNKNFKPQKFALPELDLDSIIPLKVVHTLASFIFRKTTQDHSLSLVPVILQV